MINFKVSELIGYIKNMTNKDYFLSRLSVEGEISNYNLHSSKTLFFSLKDEYAKIDCIYYSFQQSTDVKNFKNGDLVSVLGKISVVEKEGKFSLIVENIEKLGLGKLYENFEKLKKELGENGYFDFEHKKEIPRFPKKIGVITSKTGAAIKDIISITKRRNPNVDIYLYPANVQGNFAVSSMIEGLKFFENFDVDLVIIGRGGGSYEDLDCFNSKDLALEIYDFNKPIISAVGHEIDYVITDFVSDLRAPTPSAAAELAIPDLEQYMDTLNGIVNRTEVLLNNRLQNAELKMNALKEKLKSISVEKIISDKLNNYLNRLNKQRDRIFYTSDLYENKLKNIKKDIISYPFDTKIEKLETSNSILLNGVKNRIESVFFEKEKYLIQLKSKIEKIDIHNMLEAGYSIVLDENGKIINDSKKVMVGQTLEILLKSGNLRVEVINNGE